MLTKPRDPAKLAETSMYSHKRRRFSPLILVGLVVPVLLALIAGAVFVVPRVVGSRAATAAPDPNCTLTVPANALTAQGLATPYQLSATNVANGPCNEANPNQSAFVQAVIFDPNTNTISAYTPLVIDQGTTPAAAPVVPTLPNGATVGLWFGFNGTFLHLAGGTAAANCVNGLRGSDFGQFAYCNAPRFFQAANAAIQVNKLKVPPVGMGKDGQSCPTTRSFTIVDMDQSDNVQTQYLTNGGQTAQLTTANQTALANATTIGNPSDNALLSRFVDPALGCTAWQVPNLTNPGTNTATLATDELQAAANQQAPIALIPAGDEMVLVNAAANLNKVNAYRRGVDQTPARSLNGASTTTYCRNLINVALPGLQRDMTLFQNQGSPDGGATANSLFTFLANRLNATFGDGGLNCVGLLNIVNPVALTTDGNGVATAATITLKPVAAPTANGAAGAPAAPAGGTAATNTAGAAGTGPKVSPGRHDPRRPGNTKMPLW